MRNYENIYGKYNGEVSIYVIIANAGAFRPQSKPQNHFADWILVRNIGKKKFVPDFSHFCVQYAVCYQQLICIMLMKSWLKTIIEHCTEAGDEVRFGLVC